MAWTALLRVFRPDTPGLGRRLAALPRMIKATLKREYDGGSRLLMLAAAGVYIISPIDAVPEAFLLVFGLVDDLAMAGYFAGALMDELERFLEWEKLRDNVVQGHVVGQSGRSR
ncbi:YkvA family protein [Dactylosporangium sp. NPDC000555]|uniref:YkvA family protein n=1 Tax=Dactylosporangium sp. NPDC000555 TaxID=3154260 RepID=UPI00331F2F00